MKIVAIVQARMTSTRLPGKVMMDVGGRPLIQMMLERVQKTKLIDEVVVAMPDEEQSHDLEKLCISLNLTISKGSRDDVLSRFATAARTNNADIVVRLCSDCPLIDPGLIDKTIQYFLDNDYDYVNNVQKRTYPDGLDVEVLKASALYQSETEATNAKHREHVTTYIDGRIEGLEHGKFKCSAINNDVSYGHLMWSVNTQDNLNHVRKLYHTLADQSHFTWHDLLECEKIIDRTV